MLEYQIHSRETKQIGDSHLPFQSIFTIENVDAFDTKEGRGTVLLRTFKGNSRTVQDH